MLRAARLSAALLLVTAAGILPAACGGGGDRGFMSFGTAPPGGAFFVVGGALVEVLNEAGAGRGWNITAEATSGSQENIRRLASGELDFAVSNSAITYFAARGGEGWDQAYPVRAVMTLAPNVAMFIAPRNSGVQRIADLRGKRVVIGPAGAGFEFFVTPLLAAHGLSYSDFTALNATQAAAVDMLADGSAAAAFIGGAVPTASITQAAASQDIVFVPYDDEAMGRLSAEYPFFDRATVPAGTYRGQPGALQMLDTGSMHLITSADKDEQLVYDITKTLYEGREAVVQRHAAGRAINERNAPRNTGTEFHPGAIRFYREVGIWKE
ncbi:MAG: TAXI family TRAP transporter solute-binding subunit [Acidobacteria bacterium]|nr:TAXI family TRAP transporter solute-binding subunit [Acidobacteriota bacterium]